MVNDKKNSVLTREVGNKLVYIFVAGIALCYIALSVPRYNNFQTAAYDLAFYDQAVWQYSQFQWPYNSLYQRFILGDHLTLTLPFISSLFWIWDDVRMLLIFQAIWISLSIIAIYRIAIVRKCEVSVALGLSIVYGLFYGIQYSIYWDFYPITIGVGLLAWLVYFLETNNKKWFWITLLFVFLTQENMGIAVAGIGMLYLFRPKFRRTALWFILGGVTYMLVAMPIIASFSPIGYEYMPNISLNLMSNLIGLFNHIEKRLVWQYSFQSFLFIPLFSPGAVLAVVADLWQYFVLGDRFGWMRPPATYHRGILSIFLTLGTIDGLVYLKKHFIKFAPTVAIIMMVCLSVGGTFYYQFPLVKLLSREYWQPQPWANDAIKLFNRIPKDSSVVTQQNFASHLSHRNNLYILHVRTYPTVPNPCNTASCDWLESNGKPQYLVISKSSQEYLQAHPNELDDFQRAIVNMERMGAIQEVDREGSIKRYVIMNDALSKK